MTNFTPVSAAIGGALIGLSAVLLMLFTGRIAGISGIFGGLINPQTSDRAWRTAFIVGLIAAPGITVIGGYPVPMPQVLGSYITIIVGGFLVGFGARLGTGCTSGHGICGIARLSPRSIAATSIFTVAAMVVVAMSRHVFGG
ncbi:MAG TPA: YeeE/YedE thiosulfate transporter family protein [Pseudolabrys sp.]|nr:YeeE/YedE thiosulfate transporter family protein [Pseudolabrys sp.]